MSSYNKRDVFIYINDFIKDNYPMYFREFGNGGRKKTIDLMSLINDIFNDLRSKSFSFESIINGDANEILKVSIEQYAEKNMDDINEKFYLLKDSIFDVIKRNSKFKDSPVLLDKIVMKVALGIIDEIRVDNLQNGYYDSVIFNQYLIIRGKYKTTFYEHVKNIILSSDVKIGFDELTMLEIFKDMSESMLENYTNDDVYSTENIRNSFKDISQVITKKIRFRVKKVLAEVINNADFLIDVSERKVISDIVMMATVRGEISAIKVVKGEMDGFIKSYINSIRKENISQKRSDLLSSNALEHIYDVLSKEADREITETGLRNYATDVHKILNDEGFSNDDIIKFNCDERIRQLYMDRYHPSKAAIERKRMKAASVRDRNKKENKVVDLARYAKIKKRIQQEIAKFLIASILGGVGGYCAGQYINQRNDLEAASLVQSLDSADYSIDHSSERLQKISYQDASEGIVKYYDELKQYGDEYGYLCFYNAYSVNNRITELDRLLSNVRSYCATNNSQDGLIELVSDVDCFYDYMYDCLLSMGCEEIRNDKYLDAILAYKQSFYGNRYGIPSDFHIYADDKKALEDMVKLYEEYNFKYQVELGKKIKNQRLPDEVVLNNTGVKRGV